MSDPNLEEQPSIIEETPNQKTKEFFSLVGRGLVRAGRAVGYGAKVAAIAVADGYRAVDPDLRRHIAQLPLMGLTMLSSRKPTITPLPDDGHRPIVFVHGLGGHPGNFSLMKLFFRYHGRSRAYSFSFGSDEPLEEVAARLALLVAELSLQNNLSEEHRFDLVAHSMGGIVSRLALEDPSFAKKIATLVTLGTPHSGTYIARYANTMHTLSLRPNSPIVARLQAQLPWGSRPEFPRLVALHSDTDLLLLPPSAACVEGAENLEMNGFTHYSYLLHPTAFQRVFEALSPILTLRG
jgi:pimeloyl-ACP methyl ester carboxylesterase